MFKSVALILLIWASVISYFAWVDGKADEKFINRCNIDLGEPVITGNKRLCFEQGSMFIHEDR